LRIIISLWRLEEEKEVSVVSLTPESIVYIVGSLLD